MKSKMKQSKKMSLWASLLLVGLIVVAGCKKSEPAAPSESETAEAVAPSLSGAIDKAIFIEYQSKKVYFCCPGCEEKFKENPEMYLAKLPQFKE